jgi:putative phosphoesterase
MKKILLLSDTHGHMDSHILKYVSQADEVWHAGDIGDFSVTDALQKIKPLKAVYGNIDGSEIRTEFPEDLFFECEQVKVYMRHIGGRPGRYSKGVSELLIQKTPKLFVCGHSHILKVQFDKKHQTLYLNPGAVGKKGFHKIRTLLRFTLDQGDIKDLEAIELAPRK